MFARQAHGPIDLRHRGQDGRAGEMSIAMDEIALEIQEGVFLAGRVEMRDGKVTSVHKPELR